MGSDQRPARLASCLALTLTLSASLGPAMSIATAEERNSTAGARTAQPVKDGAVLAVQSIDRAKSAKKQAAAEVRFLDGSNLKLTVLDENLEMSTRYGELVIPVRDIRVVEFATRIPEKAAKQIATAIDNLGSAQFRTREAATAELLAFKEKAYAALLQAARHADPEVVRRAGELLAKLRETVPDDILEVRDEDVVYTDDMKIAGLLRVTHLKVLTGQFGEQQLKLFDLHSLRSLATGGVEPDSKSVLPDPGNLASLQGQVGRTFHIRVTGALNGSVWGTKTYTTDSALATAAVHAGILQPGQTGVVRVTIVTPPAAFQGSTQNGVSSNAYGAYQGAYRLGR
ncbi:MAG TPA: LCCL domain-containing protein [Gemmataceae bacterium]|nr:LCCL domain-containing protein [Gemmataceae bacterium]